MGFIQKLLRDAFDSVFRPEKYKKRKKGKQNNKKGLAGELSTIKELNSRGYKGCVLHDVMIRDQKTGKMAQLDVVVITNRVIYILEVKTQNFHTIQGKLSDENWTLIYGKNSMFKSNNIYQQIERQKSALKSVMAKHNVALPIKSYILVRSGNNITVQIPGLTEAGVNIIQSTGKIPKPTKAVPHSLLIKVLESENKKNEFVRRYHAK